MNKYLIEAKKIRESINGLAENQSDKNLIDNMAAFPFWNGNGVFYAVGTLLQYGGKLYRVVQAHVSQSDWSPDKVPALFTEVSVEEFPEWKQPTGAQDAYNTGDKVSHNSKHWISTIDNNVWEPGAYGWNEIEVTA